MVPAPVGRPRTASRAVLAEAAAELFLERGYAATRVADIARVAGVSRASFFNCFASKADVLWLGVDDALDRFETALLAASSVRAALLDVAESTPSDAAAVALAHAELVAADEELAASGAVRIARLHALIVRVTSDPIDAAVITAAVSAAWTDWVRHGAGRRPLAAVLGAALDRVGDGIGLARDRAAAAD